MKLYPLFPCKSTKKAESSLVAALLFFVLSYLLLVLGQSAFLWIFSMALPAYAEPLSLLGAAAVCLPILFYCRCLEKLSLRELFIRKERLALHLVLGLTLGILLAALLVSLLLLLGAYELLGICGDSGAPLLLLLAYFVQGSAEELLCRGFLLSVLCRSLGGWRAAAVSAVTFSLLHCFNPSVSLIGLLNIFLFGLLFASLTLRSGSLAAAAAMHAGWNFSVSLCGAEVSGNEALGAQISLSQRLPFLSGGAFGPEGSPLLTLLLLLSLAFLCIFPIAHSKNE